MSANELSIFTEYLYKKCGMSKKLTTNEFIEKSRKVHGDNYDYSLVNYKNNKTKVNIICPKHGIFKQKSNSHLSGHGCVKCGLSKIKEKNQLTTNKFIKKSEMLHGNKYGYSLVEYKSSKEKVNIICSKHGIFRLKPNCHLTGSGCPRCVGRGKTTKDFIIEANKKHGNKFNYSLVTYKSTHKKIKIKCSKHGVFKQSPNQHLNGGMCPKCNESKGENEIRVFLELNKINFISQHKFSDCKHIRPLSFDFYLPTYNMCIEYQGIQHYKPINYFGGKKTFLLEQKKDKIKRNYCSKNNIALVEISYTDNIKDFLKIIL